MPLKKKLNKLLKRRFFGAPSSQAARLLDYVNSFLNDREFFHLKYLVVNSETGPEEIVIFHSSNESIHKDEDIVARDLAQKVKVLCWIMTQPDNHKGKVRRNDDNF